MSTKKETFTIRPFEKLRKTIDRHAAAVSPPPIQKRKKKELTEEELFSTAMDDVQVIEAFRKLSCKRRDRGNSAPCAIRRTSDEEVKEILTAITEGAAPMSLTETQEYVEWSNPEYSTALTEQLHDGLFSVQAFLDLHGFTVPEAEEELEVFMREAFIKGLRCVKIIHGRGLRSVNGPRIKTAVIRRLLGRHRKELIAYASAPQCDGGLGAIYVLLANSKKP